MTAHEEQDERVVFFAPAIDLDCRRQLVHFHRRSGLTAPARELATHAIDHAPGSDLSQPRTGIVGDALPRPLSGRRDQRLLDCVFGAGEITESPDYGAEHLR